MAAAQHTFGLDVTALVGFLRFGLKWKEEDIQTFLRGHGLSVSQASLSLRTTEFLVRWQMFSEVRLLHLAPQLRPFVLQIDGTCVEGGPVTFRVREARSGVTLYARQIVAESLEEVVPVLVAFKVRFGDPALTLVSINRHDEDGSEGGEHPTEVAHAVRPGSNGPGPRNT